MGQPGGFQRDRLAVGRLGLATRRSVAPRAERPALVCSSSPSALTLGDPCCSGLRWGVGLGGACRGVSGRWSVDPVSVLQGSGGHGWVGGSAGPGPI